MTSPHDTSFDLPQRPLPARLRSSSQTWDVDAVDGVANNSRVDRGTMPVRDGMIASIFDAVRGRGNMYCLYFLFT
jgi:hypothetical protein